MKRELLNGLMSMPVTDTELLFLLNPREPRHRYALRALETVKELVVPDIALLEFELVLRARGYSPERISMAVKAIKKILSDYGIEEKSFIDSTLLLVHLELEKLYRLSFFDSLLAATALIYDRKILSDDPAFDRVPNITRIPIVQPS